MSKILKHYQSFTSILNGRTLPNATIAADSILSSHIGFKNVYPPKTGVQHLSWYSKLGDDGLQKKNKVKRFTNSIIGNHIDFIPSMMNLQENQESNSNSQKAPKYSETLVVLCGWLEAKEKYLNKYVDLYHRRDIDILRVKSRWVDWLAPDQIMVPNSVHVAYGLNEICAIYSNIVFHCFSTGCYFYASVIDAIQKDPGLEATLVPHLKGVVFDCLADVTYVLTHKKAMAEVLNPKVMEMYPAKPFPNLLSSRQTCPPVLRVSPAKLDFYIQKNKIIQENPYKLPTLLLFSKIDAISEVNSNFELAKKLHSKGVDVMSQCWGDAPHVQLYRNYPEEYNDWIGSFLSRVTKN